MVSLFKEKSAASVFWLILISLGLHIQFIYHSPVIIASANDGLLYGALNSLKELPGILLAVLYQVIVLLQAFILNYILNEARMFAKPAYTTALAYILLTAMLPEWNNISEALVANFIVIAIVYQVTILYNNEKPKTATYNMGLLAGLGMLIYYPLLSLLLIVFFALLSLRPFKINELFILTLGIITPLYFFSAYLFLSDRLNEIFLIKDIFQWHFIQQENMLSAIITFSICGLVILYGIYVWQISNSRLIIQVRRNWLILFLMLLLFLPCLFLIKISWLYALLVLAVPAAAFASYGFIHPQRNILPAIFFWLLVAIIFYNNWFLIKK